MLAEFGAAQAASWRQQRDRVKQIGLAGTIGARKHNWRATGQDFDTGVGAEIGQPQSRDGKRAFLPRPLGHGGNLHVRYAIQTYTRIGMRT